MNRRRLLHRLVFYGHRYLGAILAGFLVMLALTGLMLNHTHELKLDERFIQNRTVLAWYGIRVPAPGPSYRLGERWLTHFAGMLYLDSQAIISCQGRLQGVVSTGDFMVAACRDELLLLTPSGELIERIGDVHALPTVVERIGLTNDKQLVVSGGQRIFQADENMIEWRQQSLHSVAWSTPSAPPDELMREIQQAYRGQGLTLERLILDTHSGRILGIPGWMVMDTVAVMLLLLTGMGLWMWWQR